MTVATTASEREKYERVWRVPEYRHACHGLALWQGRRDLFPARVASAVDLGCGSGRLVALWCEAGVDGWGVDIAANCMDPDVAARWGDRLIVACLWEMPIMRPFDLGVSTDVMEHVPRERVRESLVRIGRSCREVVFKIAHSPNQLGGEVLHLTLEPHEWWEREMVAARGGAVEYLGVQMRSGCEDSLIRWRPDQCS